MNNILNDIKKGMLFLAPLAGFTDLPFRVLCKLNGADVLVTEMVSADGVIRDQSKTLDYTVFRDIERPLGIQLFGSDPLIMAKAVEKLLPDNPDFFDVNMGCPVKKVAKRFAGSALMKTSEIAGAIVREMKQSLAGTDIPLSVKIRSGWDASSINAVEFAKCLEDAGADFLTVHPRTRAQMYSGEADHNVTSAVAENVSIPVVANGDIRTVEDAVKVKQLTGCSSIMIGRGALGKPWIFDQIKQYYLTGEVKEYSKEFKLETLRKHLDLAIGYKDTKKTVVDLRSHLAYYTKGTKGGSRIRAFINKSERMDEIYEAVAELW